MTRIYVSEQGTIVRKQGGRLAVEKNGVTLSTYPLATLEQVTIVGRGVQITTAALVDLLGRGVDVAFLSRYGRFYGKALGAPNGAVELRAAQHAFLAQEANRLQFARDVALPKIAGQLDVLRHLGVAPGTIASIEAIRETVPSATSVDSLRGFEGAAAATYWATIVSMLPPAWEFKGRRHHPPPDPVNAALSFGYTLLLQELLSNIHLVGLDPFLGALHVPSARRPALAFDLEEPLRPRGVDAWVFQAIRDGTLDRRHFQIETGRTLLTAEGRRRYLNLYEHAIGQRVRHELARGRIPLRMALELHVRSAARLFSGEASEMGTPTWL